MESDQELKQNLSVLVGEYGLVEVLKAMKDLMQNKMAIVEELEPKQTKAFDGVIFALGVLVEALPEAIDVELALEQVTHTASDLDSESDAIKLASGME